MKYLFTHRHGGTIEVEARDILDAVFSFKGEYKTLVSVQEVKYTPISRTSIENWEAGMGFLGEPIKL